MATIAGNLQAIKARIAAASAAVGRDPASVTLLAVSKTHPAALLAEACAAGQRAFGENYVQEAVAKMEALALLIGADAARALEWHLIGPLQSNKTRIVAEHFAWIHTIEREKIAHRLSEQRPAGLAPLQVLVQVNVSGEASKSGVAARQVAALARTVAAMPRLRLRGLMAIPEPSEDAAIQRARFRAVRRLFERLVEDGLALDTLSMGMSDDFDAAILEGATIVRIGTAVFGPRQ